MKNRTQILLVSLICLGTFTAGPRPVAADGGRAGKHFKDSKSMSDSDFVHAASRGGQMEVELGQMATQKASNSAVQDFGRRMVKDHSEANMKLKELASTEHMPVPAGMSPKSSKHMAKFQGLSGGEFDKAYIDHMVRDHEKDIAAFEREAQDGKNAHIKKFAADTLPTLREHLKLAKEAQEKVRG